MLHKLPHVGGRKVTPPQPTFMDREQKSEYLASLRNNRPARPTPTGSRPAPFKPRTSTDRYGIPRAESAMSLRGGGENAGNRALEESDEIPRSQSSIGHRHSMLSERAVPSLRSTKGRPLVQAPIDITPSMRSRKVSPTSTIGSATKDTEIMYKESGSRWLERQEAHALRQALELMDARSEEKRIFQAAQEEAADLVYQHQRPGQAERERNAGYRNPDLPKKVNTHLVPITHERSQSDGVIALRRTEPIPEQQRTVSGGSENSIIEPVKAENCIGKPKSKKKRLSDAMQQLRIASGQALSSVDTGPLRNFSGGRRRMSGQRKSSNNLTTFPNSEDKIFEEPESASNKPSPNSLQQDATALKITSSNSVPNESRIQPQKADTISVASKPRPNPFDRRRKQAEQPKAAPYTSNASTPIPTIVEPDNTPTKEGKEIRSDDIRAATSMKRSDRSPKLPTPTAVSDRVGRPIVSFDPAWKPPSENKQQVSQSYARPEIPAVTVSAPALPTIYLPNDDDPYDPPLSENNRASLPTINVSGDSAPPIPTFNFDLADTQEEKPSVTALPAMIAPTKPSPPTRPLPKHTQSLPIKPSSNNTTTKTPSRLPWLQRNTPTATCASCILPISGRIVTASDASETQKAMFHPTCFTCNHCNTALECVAFYPEPEKRRLDRLEQEGLEWENNALRFYCHLDFHEFFSPRCRSCKTPIEGEVIVAAGAEYHVGHFFCAECGDPFESDAPFVERDGYAYCVSCHRKRTSGRCRGCKALILDEGCVEALGGQWHEKCFRCYECDGDFGGDNRFYLREVEVETTAKERRKGMLRKVEERPVCKGCEERRLKA